MHDPSINVCSLSGLSEGRLPDVVAEACNIHLSIRASSLAALTGVDVRSGALFDARSQTAVLATESGKKIDRYWWTNSLSHVPEFAAAISYRQGRFIAVTEDALKSAWGQYESRILKKAQARDDRAKLNHRKASLAAFERLLDLGSH